MLKSHQIPVANLELADVRAFQTIIYDWYLIKIVEFWNFLRK